ncbi:transcription elongation factor SPT6-like isoform X3 [Amphibalanus amphitrite]|nr:transcription elongation factor SPT6-like isoform X3 [Amphibalanus amphitrite]XP_043230113.1 transcription elongation factor SPT6-like isoform X3 [Amphibalanus amphitrite]XP_043230115.1 transcription elongation factor SPT6-like isoform X3 [Amphibalanus amphitrite]
MSEFIDSEASESEDEEELTSREKKKLKKMNKNRLQDSSEEEEDDEEAMREEMKDLIDDNPIEEEDGDDSSSSDGDGSGDERAGGDGRGARKRSREDDLDDGLEDDDYDLIEENLGVKVSRKQQLKRIRRISDSDSDEGGKERDDSGDEERPSSEGREPADHEERSAGGEGVEPDDEEVEDEEDVDDFLVDEDGKPLSKGPKKKKHIFADAALQEAQDIFGVDFDFDEFDKYGVEEESDADDEGIEEDDPDAPRRRARKKAAKKKSIYEIYEPSELERGHFTDLDNTIRKTDVPERMQLRAVPVTATELGSEDPELDQEAEWIFKHAFNDKPISTQSKDEEDEFRDKIRQSSSSVSKIRSALDFMRNKQLEVPFIASYKKEYIVPELTSNALWCIYKWDEKWCQLQKRKQNMVRLLEKMQTFQGDIVMKDINAALPEGMRVLSNEDIDRVRLADSPEELQDIYLHFRLYYGQDVAAMHEQEINKKKEEKKLQPKKKRIETRTETNEDGEEVEVEVEVTDDEAEQKAEDEDEDREFIKYAVRTGAYELCKRNGLEPLSRRFGLSPEQFAENLRDTYQRHEVEQLPSDPEEMAQQYITGNLATPQDVLKAAKFMVASQLSCEPLVRKCAREMFYSSARISCKPTKKGIKEIDESHYAFTMKYLKDKPVSSLRDEQFLKLYMAEEEKLLELDIGSKITNYSGQNYVDEAKGLYARDEFSKTVQSWNELRGECVELALTQMIFPALRKELRARLLQEARDFVQRNVRRRLFNWLSIAPYSAPFQQDDDDDDEWDSSDGVRVLAVAYETDPNMADYACLVTADGEVSDYLKLQHLQKRKDAWREADRLGKQRDMEALRELIETKKPHVIVIGGESREAIQISEELRALVQTLVTESQFPAIQVEILDNELAKVYANSTKGVSDFRDYPELLRQAVSLARRMQDPLLEFAQLCNAEEEILCLRYHPLQEQLPRDTLLDTVQTEFINRTNEVGVDVNRALASAYAAPLVQFVCGLGVRKATALLKTLKQTSQRLANRTELVTDCHLGPRILTNCAGFIKINTNALGDITDRYTDLLDGTRIHLETYDWARKMAVDALEYDDVDGNPAGALEEIIENPARLRDLDLDAFAEELERQGLGNRSITLYDIRAELNDRYKDLRTPYVSPDPLELFNMLTKETPDTLYKGKLLLCTVTGFTRRKPKPEQMNQDNPVRDTETGLWQCPFCLKKDFPELSEVWSHFDTNACPGKAIGVRIRMDNGCSGFIQMKNLSDNRVTNPEERVQPGQTIFCRVVKIDIEKFWVECTCKSSDLADKNKEWRPARDPFYDADSETADRDAAETARKQKEAQTYLKRVIVHPAFHNVDFKEARRLLATMDQGEAIIRPSSQGSDQLTVSWKVADDVIQHIAVKEVGKENAFSLGQTLLIDNEEFEDLDEILARHVSPISAHARDLLNYKYYRDTDGGKRPRADEILREEKRKNPQKIPYIVSVSKEHPGKFMLSYLPRTRPRHEFITLTPEGFRFRQQVFETIPSLFRWFKDHFRDPVPQTPRAAAARTPFTPGAGFNINNVNPEAVARVAQNLSGNVLHNLSQAAAHQTPGHYPNTPYTPSGQTPFMTPYATTPRYQGGGSSGHHGRTPGGGGGGGPHASPRYPPAGRPTTSGGRHSHPAPSVSHESHDWASAAEAWAKARGNRGTPRADPGGTPRADPGRSTPRHDGRSTPRHDGRSTPRTDGRSTPRMDGRGTPRADGRSTPRTDGRFTPRGDGSRTPRDNMPPPLTPSSRARRTPRAGETPLYDE